MRIASLALWFLLVSASAYSQDPTPTEPSVFDKKFWAVTSIMVASSIVVTEITLRNEQTYKSDRRERIYVGQGLSDLIVFTLSGGLKLNCKKYWWIPPIGMAANNAGWAIKYSVSF